jgi:hypothetical protein
MVCNLADAGPFTHEMIAKPSIKVRVLGTIRHRVTKAFSYPCFRYVDNTGEESTRACDDFKSMFRPIT